ncbi:MAG: S49 family peptidase [Geminicoccaceae bacterium]
MARLRRFLVGLLAVIGAFTVLAAGVAAVGGWWLVQKVEERRALPDSILLVADLRGSRDDRPPGGLDALRGNHPAGISELVLALDRAGRDPRVKGLVARLDDTGHGFAAVQELRDAVRRFRASGRKAVAFGDSFGELSSGNEGYYLATAFERITLQPVGLVGLTGLMAEVPFARALLDRIGVQAAFERREQYKTAFDSATETGLTPANREMLDGLLDSLSAQLVRGIAEGRNLDEAQVRTLIDGGPYDADEAVAAGLIDEQAHWDEVLDGARDGAKLVDLDAYAAATRRDAPDDGSVVAFVRASGGIARGSEGGFGSGIAADDLAQALLDATEDPDVRAILLKVDSPGGSAVASETIAHQIRRAIARGKPVIVAMGNAAASGGYWIAMGATRIVAQPGTLTGSIGVIAGKPVLAGLWDRLDIDWAQIPKGANADMWSFNVPYGALGKARLEALLDAIYASFKQGVADGRMLPPERVEEIAKGRVWSGEQAKGLGLVDELGGLIEAQAAVRTALGVAADAPLQLQPFPRPKSPLQELRALLGSDFGGMTRALGILADGLEPGTARMPGFVVR